MGTFNSNINTNTNTSSESTGRSILIGNDTTINGDIVAVGDIRIDGTLTGNLKSNGKVIIGQKGFVEGSITCRNADISGKVKGIMKVDELTSLKSTARIEVELYTKQLYAEIGAAFTGKCEMGAKPVETPEKTN